jgi:cystathionine beta-lyase/cystathionine gamma-synthase
MWGDTRNYDAAAGKAVAPGLVRLAVGIESTRDLVDDLEHGLEACRDEGAAGS